MKLSDRASLLLWIVSQNTDKDWTTGETRQFFVPFSHAYHYRDNGKQSFTYISGSRDANAFKGLERKGLIRRPKSNLPNDYIYELTEDGLLAIESIGLNSRFA